MSLAISLKTFACCASDLGLVLEESACRRSWLSAVGDFSKKYCSALRSLQPLSILFDAMALMRRKRDLDHDVMEIERRTLLDWRQRIKSWLHQDGLGVAPDARCSAPESQFDQ